MIAATPALWSLLLGALMLGGSLGRGYVLSYDMVWVPDLAVRSDFLGLGSGLPRAVPTDLVVALVDEVVPGMLLQKLVLLGTLVVAGTGAWRMVPGDGRVGPWAASTLYVWNPFVVERLGIGHWPLLMAYAALPWIYLNARSWATGGRRLPALVLWMAFASLSPVGGIVAAVFALLSAALPGAGSVRRVAWTCVAAGALNAPWVVAGALHGSATLSDPDAVTVFAAQGEGPLPPVLALMGLGGIWNAEVVPVSRTQWPAAVALLVVLSMCAAGIASWRRRTTASDRSVLLAAGAVGLLLAAAGALVPGAVGWVVAHVPGAGLVRDGSRFIALLAPLQATLFGLGVARAASAVPIRSGGVVAATALALSPVALMPDAALGLSGRLDAVGYPTEYAQAERALSERMEAGRSGDLLLLPFTPFRLPPWNDGRRTLNPLERYLPANYLSSDVLVVSGREIPGEDVRAQEVARILRTPDDEGVEQALRELGIAWVVVDHEAERALGASAPGLSATPGDSEVLHRGDLLTLWELPAEEVRASDPWTGRVPELLLLVLAWAAAGGALCMALVQLWRVRRPVARKCDPADDEMLP
ncbi:hypothetical protein [Nocardioides seonyuensis]|uniref:hypothetical protein n=1 Tax=Nocardioides seonyuensis TaxID=2518371 RepID=UPI001422FB5E|nr:hypothetical protein [Nocardioides seonyuensis]